MRRSAVIYNCPRSYRAACNKACYTVWEQHCCHQETALAAFCCLKPYSRDRRNLARADRAALPDPIRHRRRGCQIFLAYFHTVRTEGEAFPHRGVVKGIAFAYFNSMGNRIGGVLAWKGIFFILFFLSLQFRKYSGLGLGKHISVPITCRWFIWQQLSLQRETKLIWNNVVVNNIGGKQFTSLCNSQHTLCWKAGTERVFISAAWRQLYELSKLSAGLQKRPACFHYLYQSEETNQPGICTIKCG